MIDADPVDEPDAKAFRLNLEGEARPLLAPPLEGANLRTDAPTGVGHEFESRSDSAALRHPAAQDQSDGIVARRSRSFAEQKTTLRRPAGSADDAEQAAPPVMDDDFEDDDEATDELFWQIQKMTKKFKALVAPPVPADVDEFRRLLEQARARLPPAPGHVGGG